MSITVSLSDKNQSALRDEVRREMLGVEVSHRACFIL